MIPATPEALVAGALRVLTDHQDLLVHEWARRAQARQLAEIVGLVREQDSGRPADLLAVFAKLVDCAARVERAVPDGPEWLRVRDRLRSWRTDLAFARDVALTRSLRKGPAVRRAPPPVEQRRKSSPLWNPAPPA